MLMSGKQLSLDSRIDLVQRLVTDKDGSNPQIDESSECLATPSDIEEVPEGKTKKKVGLNILKILLFVYRK